MLMEVVLELLKLLVRYHEGIADVIRISYFAFLASSRKIILGISRKITLL